MKTKSSLMGVELIKKSLNQNMVSKIVNGGSRVLQIAFWPAYRSGRQGGKRFARKRTNAYVDEKIAQPTQQKPILEHSLLMGVILAISLVILFLPLHFAHAGITDAVEDITGGMISFGEEGEEAATFTKFRGEFEPPSPAGYEEGITRSRSARELAINITNFVLSFLGLVSMIVVIYGGFLYITAGGEDEQAGKGKKSIQYALTGIIIILMSFALVNTVIREAAIGGEDRGGTGEEGEDFGEGQKAKISDAANEIEKLALGIANDYVYYIKQMNRINEADSIIGSLSGDISNNLADFRDFRSKLLLLSGTVVEIRNNADPLSKTYAHAQVLAQTLDQYTTMLTDKKLDKVIENEGNFWEYAGFKGENSVNGMKEMFKKGENKADHEELAQGKTPGIDDIQYFLEEQDYKRSISERIVDIIKVYVNSNIEELEFKRVSQKPGLIPVAHAAPKREGGVEDGGGDVGNYNPPGADGPGDGNDGEDENGKEDDEDGGNRNGTAETTAHEVKERFLTLIDFSSYEALKEIAIGDEKAVQEIFDNSVIRKGSLIKFKNSPTIDNAKAALKDISAFYDALLVVQFVEARITASSEEGAAPLTVQFDASKSYDPSDISLTDDNYYWDLDGDGKPNEGNISNNNKFTNCIEESKAVSYCTYHQPGKYRVGLKVISNKPSEIAAGQAYKSIIVNPPPLNIDLRAYPAVDLDDEDYIIKFDKDRDVYLADQTTYYATLADAQSEGNIGKGIVFDASGTKEANDTTITSYVFDFGDGAPKVSPTNIDKPIVVHAYASEGKYTMILEIEDTRKEKAKKIIDVYITSPIARIKVNPYIGERDTTFEFDGSRSKSDVGQIISYKWKAEGEDGNEINNFPSESTPEIRYKFDKPGIYKITLTVEDEAGQNSNDVVITVESKPPVVNFDYKIPNPGQPNKVHFDAAKSYDPDEEDKIASFIWTVDGEACDGKICDFDGSDDKRPIITFKKAGSFKVKLQAMDNHNATSKIEKTIKIDSVLDIDMIIKDQTGNIKRAFKINNEITFTPESSMATAYNIDFADGAAETLEKGSSIKHVYKKPGVYKVEVAAFDEEDNKNSISKQIFIGEADRPIAVIGVFIDEVEVTDLPNKEANRKSKIKFDASDSINIDGTERGLNYSWDFGDGTYSSQKTPLHTYDFKRDTPYGIELIVKDQETGKTSEAAVQIKIVGEIPVLQSLIATPQGDSLTTPVKVKLEAEAKDSDGKIVQYKWRYYEGTKEYGTQITQENNTIMTVQTHGTENEEKTYNFGLTIEDDDGQEVDWAGDTLITVKNGPNEAPTAKISVDRTNTLVGEPVNFTSSSFDPDGEIAYYYWDFDGDLAYDIEGPNKSTISYTYDQAHPDGVEIRLKVKDNNDAEAISDALKIYVDTVSEPPVAAFVITESAETASTLDAATSKAASGLSLIYHWDCDIKKDENGNGKEDDDYDMFGTAVTQRCTYEEGGVHRAKLEVTDSQGNSDSVIRFVKLEIPETSAIKLEARLTTDPERSHADNKIHLQAIDVSECGASKGAYISFNAADSQGEYDDFWLDKNIYYDTDGNGKKADDRDIKKGENFSRVYFCEDWGRIKSRLTIKNTEADKEESVDAEIVFDRTGGANILPVITAAPFYILAIFVLFVILRINRPVFQRKEVRFEKKRIKK